MNLALSNILMTICNMCIQVLRHISFLVKFHFTTHPPRYPCTLILLDQHPRKLQREKCIFELGKDGDVTTGKLGVFELGPAGMPHLFD